MTGFAFPTYQLATPPAPIHPPSNSDLTDADDARHTIDVQTGANALRLSVRLANLNPAVPHTRVQCCGMREVKVVALAYRTHATAVQFAEKA